jgi:hypothetical protein
LIHRSSCETLSGSCFSAKGAVFTISPGYRPRTNGTPEPPGLKARFTSGAFSCPHCHTVLTDEARGSSVCSFRIPYALVTLQTGRALNFASRIEHAPSPQSSPRKRGEAERCRVSLTSVEKLVLLRACQARRSTSATRINYLKQNAC